MKSTNSRGSASYWRRKNNHATTVAFFFPTKGTCYENESDLVRRVKCIFTLTILLLVVSRATAQVTLPAPTGSYQTGRLSFHWKDATRDELETKAPNDKRELMVHLFYPADAKAADNRAAYVPDADARPVE